MKIYIHFSKSKSPGYTPHDPVRLHNVQAVMDKGVGQVEIHMMFSDHQPTFDHVDRVVIEPERE